MEMGEGRKWNEKKIYNQSKRNKKENRICNTNRRHRIIDLNPKTLAQKYNVN